MTDSEIINNINRFTAKEFEIDEKTITPEAILKDTLELDSLDYIDLVAIIESNFKFRVRLKDFQNIIRFQDLYDYVTENVRTRERM